jgi:hypothetical protein
MAEILLPQYLPVAQLDLGVQDGTAADVSPVTGLVQTSEVFGVRRRTASLQFENIDRRSGNLAALRAFLSSMQGRKNRVWISDPSYQQRGSFSAPELLTNNDFSNGTTGWLDVGSSVHTASDRTLRVTSISGASNPQARQTSAPCVQYAPYVCRAVTRSPLNHAVTALFASGSIVVGNTPTAVSNGMSSVSLVTMTATMDVIAVYRPTENAFGGDFFDIMLASASRCALADGGANAVVRSNDISNAVWATDSASVTRTASAGTAPDGTVTAGQITSLGGGHYLGQRFTIPTTVLDYTVTCAVKAGTQGWSQVGWSDYLSQESWVWVNLSTGATGAQGGAATQRRVAVVSLGNGWWQVSLTARYTGGGTNMSPLIRVGNADGSTAPSGTILLWRPTISQASVPGRLVGTDAAAVTTGTSQTGTATYLKGLPASTNGLLLAGDRVQIRSYLREVIAPLNSNAAGQGVLMLDEPIPGGVADNAPVIVNNPMGRFMLAGDIGLSLSPGVFGNSALPLVEA